MSESAQRRAELIRDIRARLERGEGTVAALAPRRPTIFAAASRAVPRVLPPARSVRRNKILAEIAQHQRTIALLQRQIAECERLIARLRQRAA